MKINQLFKSLIVGVAVAVGAVAFTADAQYTYYSTDVIVPGTIISGSNAVTALAAANYPTDGGYVDTKSVSPASTIATGYTVQFVTAQWSQITNSAASSCGLPTNVVAVFAPLLDAKSLTPPVFPPPASNTFSCTLIASGTNTAFTYLALIPATNTLGAKQFKLLSLQYAGTNRLNLISCRVGHWLDPGQH